MKKSIACFLILLFAFTFVFSFAIVQNANATQCCWWNGPDCFGGLGTWTGQECVLDERNPNCYEEPICW